MHAAAFETNALPKSGHRWLLMIFRVDEETKTVFVERFFSGLEDYAEKL